MPLIHALPRPYCFLLFTSREFRVTQPSWGGGTIIIQETAVESYRHACFVNKSGVAQCMDHTLVLATDSTPSTHILADKYGKKQQHNLRYPILRYPKS